MENEKIMKEIYDIIIEKSKTFQFDENNGFSNLMNFAKHMESKIVIIPKKNEDQIPKSFAKSKLPGMEIDIYSNETNPLICVSDKIEEPFIIFYNLDNTMVMKIENCF